MKSPSSEPPPELRRALLGHYDKHQRRLPWRGETDPYRILVSEVMLQQTRVETVLDYYESWLVRFPDLESLASADVDDVLEAWEGLGYYRRARNLQRAAQVVRERPTGAFPSTYAELRELPGVGEYTAGAVASIAFGESVPAPDGNVRRVLARLFDEPEPKAAWLRETAGALVDPDRPGDWNQALMELGATVCTPRGPRCDTCPVATWCAARARGTQEERPAPLARRAPRRALFVLALLHHEGRVLLERRPPDGLLGGMWAFPEAEVADATEADATASAIALGLGGATSEALEPLPVCEHRFTHLHATYLPYLIHVSPEPIAVREGYAGEVVWVDLEEPAAIALPVAQRKILETARDFLAFGVGMKIADMTWMQVEEYLTTDDRCVVPLGCTEQHAYLSLTTDNTLAERVATEAAEPLGVPVFPVVPYGITPYFMDYPGTVTVSLATYERLLVEILGSVRRHGFRRITIVNGHGGNTPAIPAVEAWAQRRKGVALRWHDWWKAPRTRATIDAIDPDASHASWMETFPWTRVQGVEPPDGHKAPTESLHGEDLSPSRFREVIGDGSMGGFYERPDEEMQALWAVAVEETREVLSDGW